MGHREEQAHLPRLLVRAMREADRDAVAQLLLEINRVENDFTQDRHIALEAGRDCLIANEAHIAEAGGTVLVAEDAGRVVGILVLAFGMADAFVRPDLRPCAIVLDLCVDQASRGRGIGKLLLAEAERIAREDGRSALLVGAVAGNERAIALYEATGFRRQAIEFRKPLRTFDQ
jgi:ribosomal protein S18 acetylase RimI-like enzyme